MPTVTVTEIGEYVSHQSCERRFKLSNNNRAEARTIPFAERLFNTLDPVLQMEGKKREEEWEQSLRDAQFRDVISTQLRAGDNQPQISDFMAAATQATAGSLLYGRELRITGSINYFEVTGRIDFCLLHWVEGRPRIRLVECKASRRDRTYQRIQVAVYGLLTRQSIVGQVIAGFTLTEEDIECVVARIDESTNEAQAILDLIPLELNQENADLARLLSSDGTFARILDTSLINLDYQLDAKCDACVFNVHCYPETSRLRGIQLLSVEPSIIRSLAAAGISTIDQLAALDLASPQASSIRGTPGFNISLAALKQRAHARKSTLPGGQDPETFQVEALPNFPASQLPEHLTDGHRLVRIYLTVHYDYVENRIGALSAHVTTASRKLHAPWGDRDGRRVPEARLVEREPTGQNDSQGRPLYTEHAVVGGDISRFKSSPWTGRYAEDTGAEREMIQGFFQDLVDEISNAARSTRAPIHFYIWSRSEMARLIEACSRVGSGLLAHLRELLGCREPLEQLIFSCLEDEIRNRYALGWTGRGLAVVSSLRWYGQTYHWRREVNGQEIDLDSVFTQDIFDFKTDLWRDASNNWLENETANAVKHKFEIRSRFHDTLTAPYWRALWHTLPNPNTVQDGKVANAIRRYNLAGERGVFRAYLNARSHAIRWIDENVRLKNGEIKKPLLLIENLVQFTLDINGTAQAAIDFLRLDQHVAVTDWIASHLIPPAYRLPAGRTLPISNVVCTGPRKLSAEIDATNYDLNTTELQTHCTIQEGSWVRLTPCDEDPTRGQTIGKLLRLGTTCIVDTINWENGSISLSVIPQRSADLYRLQSYGHSTIGATLAARATLDESPSDFVKSKVEYRLAAMGSHHTCDWFNPVDPDLPVIPQIPEDILGVMRQTARAITLPNGRHLAPDQVDAAIDGINSRCQLLQGPPGTGKTTTTSAALLLRITGRCAPGEVVIVAANTHTAVNNLLERVAALLPSFIQESTRFGRPVHPVRLAKVESSDVSARPAVAMEILNSHTLNLGTFRALTSGSVAVIGGTTGTVLSMAKKLDGFKSIGGRTGAFQISTLIVDEASMMVFPDFLALATLVLPTGCIMLTGDHRQLAPIMAHDWEREDRPPVVLYQPYASAYDAVRNIGSTRLPIESVKMSFLRYTFRLPAVIRGLISRLYRRDEIELQGRAPEERTQPNLAATIWERLWQDAGGLFIVIHNEIRSTHSNQVEVEIIRNIMAAAPHLAENSTAIVTPHRAQKNLLTQELSDYVGVGHPIGVVDTVEKLQGGERPNIIVSATESEPSSIAARVEFILDLNRSNVAFSRAENRLIVVCAKTLLDHIPAELEDYDSTMLWKSLRESCSLSLGTDHVLGHTVTVFTPPISLLQTAES